MSSYRVVATLRSALLAVVLLGMSQPLMAQSDSLEPGASEQDTLVFKAGRRHAGGFRYIPVELSLGDGGMSWRFEDEFERHVNIPWPALKEWSCWGKRYGYKLELLVEKPEDGGGTFRLEADELGQAESYLLERVPEKVGQRCRW